MTGSPRSDSPKLLDLSQTVEALETIIAGGGLDSEEEAELVARSALQHLQEVQA